MTDRHVKRFIVLPRRNGITVAISRGDDDLNHGVAMGERLHSLDGLYLVISCRIP